jgi:sporulation protein YlmC with PRC-barrel domain
MRVSKLMGYIVESQMGEKLGSVKDMIIDMQTGRLDFVIITTGGIAGFGAKLKAVPPTVLSPATAFQGMLALDISPDRWKNAPNFSKDQIANLGNPAMVRQIYKFYGQSWPVVAQTAGAGAPLQPTGRETLGNARPRLASEVIGKVTVMSEQNEEIGKISDLLVNLHNPNVTFALLKPGSAFISKNHSLKNQLFAIPVNAFIGIASARKVILDISPGEFEKARAINAESWSRATPGPGVPRIFRYQGDDSDNAGGVTVTMASLNHEVKR